MPIYHLCLLVFSMKITDCYRSLQSQISAAKGYGKALERAIAANDLRKAQLLSHMLDASADRSLSQAASLFELAVTDGLTGLRTRGYLKEHMNSLECIPSLSCLFIDIDHFKDYNDAYGHIQGDYALRMIADIVKSYGDPNLAFRYGGEEYVLFKGGLHNDEMLFHLAENICKSVETAKIPLAEEIFMKHKGAAYTYGPQHTTISIGGSIRQHYESLDHLIHRADKALYEAKKARNSVNISE